MGVLPTTISNHKRRLEKDNPCLYFEVFDGRIESAIDFRIQGFSWAAIAKELNYTSGAACYRAVSSHIGGKATIQNLSKQRI